MYNEYELNKLIKKGDNIMSQDYDVENTKFEFYELPNEIIDELHDSVSGLLTPTALNDFCGGRMTIMDWKYKFDVLKDLLQ